uniref:BTB domain-containing protein n=1 Tax=Panagrolaimus davidi TaxID=227884 RepID=A0A914R7N5_9BILA
MNQQMFADIDGKDFTIVAEGQEIKVHKSILSQISPVFNRMFETKWKESVEGKIEYSFLSFKLAKIVMDLFYGKKYWRFLDKIEYIQLYQFADQYDITSLKNAVKNSIVLTPQNVVEYLNLVTESKSEELIRYCIDYLLTCIKYSHPMKDVQLLTNDVKLQIADLVLTSEILKVNIEKENVSRNDCRPYVEKNKLFPTQSQQIATMFPQNQFQTVPQISPSPLPPPPQMAPMPPLFPLANYAPNFGANIFSLVPNQHQNQMLQQQPTGLSQQQFLLLQQQMLLQMLNAITPPQ